VLSARFAKMHELCDGHDISLHELDRALGEDGAPLLTILLCVPFLFPMPLPGFSSVFATVIIFLEARTFFREPPALPGFVGRRRVSRDFVEKLSRRAKDASLKVEHAFTPRLGLLTEGLGRRLLSVSVIFAAIALFLPIPPVIPLTNTIPALAIMLLSAAMIFKDGVLAILGHLVHLGAWVYFWLIGGALVLLAQAAHEKLWPLVEPFFARIGFL
jgi:hypothetical protein